jgi:hypothetical protein
MMKKIVLGLLVLAAAAGAVGAQESASKMAIGLDVFPLVKGIIWSDSKADNSEFAFAPSFEYRLFPHYSIGAGLDIYFGEVMKVDFVYFGLTAHGRWYPLSTGLDKFFIDAGLGFNVFAFDGETDPDKGGMAGMTLSLKAGYKLMFNSHFFAEPAMAFVYAKTPKMGGPTPLGWQPALSIGAAF